METLFIFIAFEQLWIKINKKKINNKKWQRSKWFQICCVWESNLVGIKTTFKDFFKIQISFL